MRGDLVLCPCGCETKFKKRNNKHLYADGQRCKKRDIDRRISIGEIMPTHYNDCVVCFEPIPVYKEVPSSIGKITCDNKCGAIWRSAQSSDKSLRSSALKPHRQDYCRQDGECERYNKCLDLGAKGEWPRDRGEECFKKRKRPLTFWDKRSAIQMAPHSTNVKATEGP